MGDRNAKRAGSVTVEVVYGEPQRQVIRTVALPPGSSVEDAIEASGIREDFPGLEVHPDRVGIWARKVALSEELQEGDRVEIYRPLLIDPKEARRAKAARQAR